MMKKRRKLKEILSSILAMGLALTGFPASLAAQAKEEADISMFSSGELLVGTNNTDIFTADTEVVSEYNDVYLVRFDSAEEAMAAYSYYNDVADFVDINMEFSVSDNEINEEDAAKESSEKSGKENIDNEKKENEELISEAESDGDEAADDALSMLNEVIDEISPAPKGAIAIIDTGIATDRSGVIEWISFVSEDAADDNGHGTEMYDIIMAEDPDAHIISIKALDKDGRGRASDIYAAIEYAIEKGVSLINLSVSAYSTMDSETIRSAVADAAKAGITVVGAAGNNGRNVKYYIPGNIPEVLVVGAVNQDGTRAASSNYGDTVDYYAVADSTSRAAALVTGRISAKGIGALSESEDIFDSDKVKNIENNIKEASSNGDNEDKELKNDNEDVAGRVEGYGGEDAGFKIAFSAIDSETLKRQNTDSGMTWDTYFLGDNHNVKSSALYHLEQNLSDFDKTGYANTKAEQKYLNTPYLTTAPSSTSGVRPGSGLNCTAFPVWVLYNLGVSESAVKSEVYKSWLGGTIYSLTQWSYWARTKVADKTLLMYSYSDINTALASGKLKRGDLIIFEPKNSGSSSVIDHHVGIFWGDSPNDNKLWHSCSAHSGETIYKGSASGNKITNMYAKYEPSQVWVFPSSEFEYYFDIQKSVSTAGISMAGAEYTITNARDNSVLCVAVLNKDGKIASIKNVTGNQLFDITLSGGRIKVIENVSSARIAAGDTRLNIKAEETKAAPGLGKTSGYYATSISNGLSNAVTLNKSSSQIFNDSTALGMIEVIKVGENGELLQGARFTVKDASGNAVGVINTNSDGYGHIGGLRVGKYTVQETAAPGGYIISDKVYTVNVKPTGYCYNGEDYSLVFNPTYYKNRYPYDIGPMTDDQAFQHYINYGIKEGRIASDSFFANEYIARFPSLSNETAVLDFIRNGASSKDKAGRSKATHIAWSIGIRNDNTSIVTIKADNVKESVPTVGTSASVVETSSRLVPQDSDITISDIVSYTNLKPSTDYTLVGRLMVVEEDGSYSSYKKNGADYVVAKSFRTPSSEKNITGTEAVDFSVNTNGMSGKNIVVFEKLYLGTSVPANDSAALQYSENQMVFPVVHEDIESLTQTVNVPHLKTLAAGEDSEGHLLLPEEDAVVTDTITYKNLLAGESYTVKGKLIDKATGKTAVDADGKEITAETSFKAASQNGTVDVTYRFNASNMAGKTLVVYEYVYYKNVLVMTHADINDKEQTVYFPAGRTVVKDDKTKDAITLAEKQVSITDTLYYENLTAGKKYKASGVLMDKETGKPLLDASGKEIKSEKEFTPDAASGTVDIPFSFDASLLEGKKIVVFEDVYSGNKRVIVHHDINDEKQTIRIPKGGTTLTDDKTKEHLTFAEKAASVTDTVAYENLIPNKEYVVKGTLMDKSTGKAIQDSAGKPVTGETTFTPDKESGTVDVSFTFDASLLTGKTIVAFETVTFNDKAVIIHADIEDEAQTTYVPGGKTTAKDVKTGGHTALAEKSAKLIDTITYSNLIPGKEYTAHGVLMNKADGKAVQNAYGKEVTSEVKFTPSASNGSVEVEFEYDASILSGNTVVVFEDVLLNGKQVFIHHDINDEEQSVHIPEGSTSARDGKTGEGIASADTNAEIVDTVYFTNLVEGESYTATGVLMDKETEMSLLDEEGNAITGSVTFYPTSPDGYINVPFSFDASGLKGKSVVVFEDVYYECEKVISHHDINDKDQTIDYPDCGTVAQLENVGRISAPGDNVKIVDKVSYTKLVPGDRFIVKGYLMDKNTGDRFLAGGKEVTSEKEFIAESADGSIDMEFTFNSEGVESLDIVVFEEIYLVKELDGERVELLITDHLDITDEDQTVSFAVSPATNESVKTGDMTPVMYLVAAAAAAFMGALLILKRRGRKSDE